MLTLVAGLILSLSAAGEATGSPLQNLGVLDAHVLPEISGIVKSRRFDNTFWVHNDSGNPPALFAIRRDGTITRRYQLEVANVDWEDIAIDDQGHLFLGDIGNNGGRLPMRVIYRLDEPDPSVAVERPLRATKASFYSFERSHCFDAESLFVDQGRAFLVAKSFDRHEATLYEVTFDNPGAIFRPVLPRRVGSLPRFREPATGADLSTDRRLLAVCSSTVTRIYKRQTNGDVSQPDVRWALIAEVAYTSWPVEAICWDGRDLLLAGENGRIARILESTWRARSAVVVGSTGHEPFATSPVNVQRDNSKSTGQADPQKGARRD